MLAQTTHSVRQTNPIDGSSQRVNITLSCVLLATHQFGSHVAEKMLSLLANLTYDFGFGQDT